LRIGSTDSAIDDVEQQAEYSGDDTTFDDRAPGAP
jgi:hypothetical protein